MTNAKNKLVCILATAGLLVTAMGCGKAGDKRDDARLRTNAEPSPQNQQPSGRGTRTTNPTGPDEQNQEVQNQEAQNIAGHSSVGEIPQPLSPNQVPRECSAQEFSDLIQWRNQVNAANAAIDQAQGHKASGALQTAQTASLSCDQRVDYHKEKPCRKTRKTIVGEEVRIYDESLLMKDCQKLNMYLVKYNALPDKGGTSTKHPPEQPPTSQQPIPQPPLPPPTPSNGANADRECSAEEFSQLSQMSVLESKANTAIKALGSSTQWKYESNAIASAALLVKSCEPLIQYHAQNPCHKAVKQTDGLLVKKSYDEASLRQRCQLARTYFYEFVQNTKTLNFANADLYLDFSVMKEKVFQPGLSSESHGNCIIENTSSVPVSYADQYVLLKDSRADISSKMIVFETQEGILVQCYGLNIDGPFSKRQIERVLKEENTDIRLMYQLK